MTAAALTASVAASTTSKAANSTSVSYSSSPSLSSGSGGTTDTSTTSNEDYEKGSFHQSNPGNTSSPETCDLSFSRPSLEPRASSYYKRHSSFDTPREVPLPSGLTEFPFPSTFGEQDTVFERSEEAITPAAPLTASPKTGAKRPQLTTRRSTPSTALFSPYQTSDPLQASLTSLSHRPTQSGPPDLQRSSSSSCSLPLSGLQSVHTLPQLETSPPEKPLLEKFPEHSAEEDDMYPYASNVNVPAPPPSPPLPVRALSPPPSKRRGLLARSKSQRTTPSPSATSPASPDHSPASSPLPAPSPPLLASPIGSEGSAYASNTPPRTPGEPSTSSLTFSSVPPPVPTLSPPPPRSPKKKATSPVPPSPKSPQRRRGYGELHGSVSFPSPPTKEKPIHPPNVVAEGISSEQADARVSHPPHVSGLLPPLGEDITLLHPSTAPLDANLRDSYFPLPITPSPPPPPDTQLQSQAQNQAQTRITSLPAAFASKFHTASNPVSPSLGPSTFFATGPSSYLRSSMPKFSLDAQGGYAKGKRSMQLPRAPSLAQAPPELRNQMLLGSTRGRRGRVGGPAPPPSPPTILDSHATDEEWVKSNPPNLATVPPAAVGPLEGGRPRTDAKPVETPSHLSDPHHGHHGHRDHSGHSSQSTSLSPSRKPHERFLAKAGLPPPPDSNTGYIAVSTHTTHYEIIVRLEGVSLNSITLSTRRRRVLHIAADFYEDGGPALGGGGHWERRIGFGWDADLTAVRAEFDGRFLKVVVPRKEDDGT